MNYDTLCIRDGIRIEPKILFRLSKRYNCDFNLCDIGILYLFNRHQTVIEDSIKTIDNITYYWVTIKEIVDWFSQYSFYVESDIRKSLFQLTHCRAVITPEEYPFCLSDSGIWIFETDEMWQLLDPCGYAESRSFDLAYDLLLEKEFSTEKRVRSVGTKGWVYCFYNATTGLSKIGITKDLDQRQCSLECSTGVPLEFIVAMKCTDYAKCEHKLHTQFKDARQSGEWFLLDKPTTSSMKVCFEKTAADNGYVISEWKESI